MTENIESLKREIAELKKQINTCLNGCSCDSAIKCIFCQYRSGKLEILKRLLAAMEDAEKKGRKYASKIKDR